jgi:tetratricopeptide (TPR) repeat protein
MVEVAWSVLIWLSGTGRASEGLDFADLALARGPTFEQTTSPMMRLMIAGVQNMRAEALVDVGRPHEAIEAFSLAEQSSVTIGDPQGPVIAARGLAVSHALLGDDEAALAEMHRAMQLADDWGDERHRLRSRHGIAVLLIEQHWLSGAGDEVLTEAERWLAEAEEILPAEQRRSPYVTMMRARLCLARGEIQQARDEIEKARRVIVDWNDGPTGILSTLAHHIAIVLVHTDDPGAEEAIENLDAFVRTKDASLYAPMVHEHRAALARRQGDEATRRIELRHAIDIYRRIDAPLQIERIERDLAD